MDKNPHHLIMGELVDFLSGRTLADTHDERYRQKLARYLVNTLKYDRDMIEPNRDLTIQAQGRTARIKVDFLVRVSGQGAMLIKYGPGSLVTRRLSNLALSRLVLDHQIPVVVTTNGEDAEVIDGATGKVTGQGLEAVPDRDSLSALIEENSPVPVSKALFEKASRIAYACEIDGACPCDTDVCRLD